MAAVARTQMVNISNIIRNQAIAWTNIISNQVKNARDALTRQFMSMAAVARTQMSKVASAVSSSMGKVSSATSKGVSMNFNVNRNVSTGYTMPSANALYAANAGATFSLGNNMSAFANNASYAAPSGNSGSSSSDSAGGGMVIEVPLYLDGKVVARATAKYVDGELKQMAKRENRKRGAK
jgi:phage-related protein